VHFHDWRYVVVTRITEAHDIDNRRRYIRSNLVASRNFLFTRRHIMTTQQQRERLYAERNPMAQDKAGNYYCKHIMAMTAEDLHIKSSIAMELAHRDMLIDELKSKLEEKCVVELPLSIPLLDVNARVMLEHEVMAAIIASGATVKTAL
jgi:hypothetical protein